MRNFFLLFVILLITACTPTVPVAENQLPTVIQTETDEIATSTLIPTPTSTLQVEPTLTITPTDIPNYSSSPLQGYSVDELLAMISNLYNPPSPGSDDPHQGVDFSVVDPTLGYAIKGAAVQSILDGEVVMIINNRFPYGNSIFIETPISKLPRAWQDYLAEIDPPGLFGVNPALTCPPGWDQVENESGDLSLFILYAHMNEEPTYEIGDMVNSGEVIGTIGDSGNVLAPHIHVEIRYGYSGSLSGGMAHYDVTTNEEEMANYCRWRVSGFYRLVNPMDVLFLDP